MRKLSKSFNEFLSSGGWSANKFLDHAIYLHKKFVGNVEIGRSVVYLGNDSNQVKVYVHHNGRSPDYMTITDFKGTELETFHHTDAPEEMLYAINHYLK